MLAVTQFFEDDDMAFVLDRMLAYENPMRARMTSGRYFVRYVIIEDATQRRSICNALNQWIVSSAEKATGIGPHFATSLELPIATELAHAASAVQRTQSEAKGSDFSQENVEERRLSAASGTSDDAALAAVPLASREPKTHAAISNPMQPDGRPINTAPRLNSAIATNIHCSSSFPSGF
jgi:hypothetical protein